VIGGLGEAIAREMVLADVRPTSFRHIGLPDEFLAAGALPTLHDRYGISVDAITTSVKGWLK
jgi:transketolase